MATFINKAQVAQLLGISEPTVANWMKAGTLAEGTHWTKLGNRLFFNRHEILKLLPGSIEAEAQ
jgi:hypothetical protein